MHIKELLDYLQQFLDVQITMVHTTSQKNQYPYEISRALAYKSLSVYGNGENVRDWLHIADHYFAIDLIIHKGKVGEVYNVGGHNERTNLEVVKTILKVLDKIESLINYVTDRP